MKIRVINPNTTWSMTQKIGEAARTAASSGTEIVAVSPEMGPVSIEGHYDHAMASLGVLDEIAKGEKEGFDGYVIACFGDPGLAAAREFARGPVVGIAESAMHMASFVSDGFTIVSMLARSLTGMEHLVHAYGMDKKCRGIRMIDLPVLKLEEEGTNSRAEIVEECRKALIEDHSDCVLLGCAGMSDLSAYIAEQIGAPAIDGVAAGVKMVEALVSLGVRTSKSKGYGFPLPKPYAGSLSQYAPQLARDS
jgi:allantoin racemase